MLVECLDELARQTRPAQCPGTNFTRGCGCRCSPLHFFLQVDRPCSERDLYQTNLERFNFDQSLQQLRSAFCMTTLQSQDPSWSWTFSPNRRILHEGFGEDVHSMLCHLTTRKKSPNSFLQQDGSVRARLSWLSLSGDQVGFVHVGSLSCLCSVSRRFKPWGSV